MIRARLDNNKVNPKYVFHFFKSKEGKRRMRRIVGFTTVAGITSTDLAKVYIPNISINRQNKIVKYLDGYDETILSIDLKIKTSKSLQKSLINQIF